MRARLLQRRGNGRLQVLLLPVAWRLFVLVLAIVTGGTGVGLWRTGQADLEDLGHVKEGLTIDAEVKLTELRVVHRSRGKGHNFQNMVALHGPTKLKLARPTNTVVNFLLIHRDLTLSGREGPDHVHFVLRSTAGSACFSALHGLLAREAKSPVS